MVKMMNRLLFMIPMLGSPLLWAENPPAASSVSKPQQAENGDATSEKVLVATEDQGKNASKKKEGDYSVVGKMGKGERQHGRGGVNWKEMNEAQRERLLYYHHLIVKKYDLNGNGRFDPEELDAMKKDSERLREDRRVALLKKYDKDGDGRLSDEERQSLRDEVRTSIEKRLQERKSGKSSDDDDEIMPPPPGRHRHGKPGEEHAGKSPATDDKKNDDKSGEGKGSEGRREGREGKGKGGHAHGWGPERMLMNHGFHVMMEKFDKDKDGTLSPEEKKAYQEDRAQFRKWLNSVREKLRAKGKLEEVEKNPPPFMPPPPASSDCNHEPVSPQQDAEKK